MIILKRYPSDIILKDNRKWCESDSVESLEDELLDLYIENENLKKEISQLKIVAKIDCKKVMALESLLSNKK